MHHGEYSHLLWQIRRRKAEHLWEDCWRVTLPGDTAERWRCVATVGG
jgi:hypothetical protein